MKPYQYVVLSALLFATSLLAACNSNKEQNVTNPVTPAQVQQVPIKTVPVVSQDKADADVVAAQVLAQFKAGDFKSIYRNASAGFQEIGTEGQFVGVAQQTRARTGPVKDIKEIKYFGLVGNYTVYLYEVRYDSVVSELRLSFGRSKSGKMELCGLNQRDVVRKK